MAYEANLRDLHFVLFEMLPLARLLATARHADCGPDVIRMVIGEADKLARARLAPLNKSGDEHGARHNGTGVEMPPGFREAWEAFAEGGWIGVAGDPEHGGQGLPFVLKIAVDELFLAANTSFALIGGLGSAASNVIADFGSDELKGLYLEKIYSGRWAATMCLTEPGAGSALGGIRTQAEKIPGTDRYRIAGNKIFITMGDHDLTENIVHLVLAKVPGAPSGTRGISLFVVPKFRVGADGKPGEPNDVVCTRIEHKMGIRASATCQLAFGDRGECEGVLIGEENKGLAYMFRMMNEERVEVGLQGVALASAAFHYARRYCEERAQGPHWTRRRDKDAPNVPIIEHPDVRRMLWWQRSHVEGMRALLLTTACYADLSYSLADEYERAKCAAFVELLTPVCKAYCTDRGFDATIMAIQCLGGYGYSSEYDAEQYARDAKIGSIYEGTNFIQAQDFVGRKASMSGGAVFDAYLQVIEADLAAAEGLRELAQSVAIVREAKSATEATVRTLVQSERDPKAGFLASCHAADALQMMGDLCVAHLLVRQATIASAAIDTACREAGAATPEARRALVGGSEGLRFYADKIAAARFFTTQILPGVFGRARAVSFEDDTAVRVRP